MPSQAPGVLGFYFAEAVLLTIVFSLILLFAYRLSVARRMRAASLDRSPSEAGALPAPSSRVCRQGNGVPAPTRRGPGARIVTVYGAAGAVAAAVLTALYLQQLGDEVHALRTFVVWYVYGWPVPLTLGALLAWPTRKVLLAVAGYLLAGAAVVLIWATVLRLLLGRVDVSPLAQTYNAGLFLLLQAQIPFLIIVVTGNRRLRSVSPLVLAGLLVFCFGNLFVSDLVRWTLDVPSLRWLVVHLARTELVFMLAAIPIGYACWRLMRWLSARYERKAFSDTQLLVDTWWLIVAFYESMQLAVGFGWGGLLALLAFVAYRLVVALGLRLWPIDPAPYGRGRLLLLRVFGFRRRSERLFDAVAQRWRLHGSVRLIAATDLATRTIDPGDMIRFLGGRLRRLFVRNPADLAERLALIDEARDPDGRFRLAKFFCHDDTWRPTLQALLDRSDAVLMDLRGFSAKNSGCVFELQQLAAMGLLPRTLFVVDATTDVALLERTLGRPSGAARSLNLEPLASRSPSALDHVLERLMTLGHDAAALGRVHGPGSALVP